MAKEIRKVKMAENKGQPSGVDSRVRLKQIQGKQAVELSPPENKGILSPERLEDST
jgi:hypothetical protein